MHANSSFKAQPINWLILLEQVVHQVCGNFVLVNFFVSQSMGLSGERDRIRSTYVALSIKLCSYK
jgi:hypothetical protein